LISSSAGIVAIINPLSVDIFAAIIRPIEEKRHEHKNTPTINAAISETE
jgi:hypothetical protein